MYRHGRNLYQLLFNRDHIRERELRRAWYRQFVSPGDLVFDVGAHRGHYAETFREIGARVVAVEANPELAMQITRRFPGISVEAIAVGADSGELPFHIGRDTEHRRSPHPGHARRPTDGSTRSRSRSAPSIG